MHKCPHPDCSEMMPHHILACKPHWFMLPRAIRDEVNVTWQSGDSTTYMAARQKAVDYWESKAKPKTAKLL